MASETVKKVLTAEAESDKAIAEARLTADKLVSNAEELAGRALSEKLEAAEKDCERIRADNQSRIDDFRRSSEESCRKQCEELKKLAELRMSGAADAVIGILFGE